MNFGARAALLCATLLLCFSAENRAVGQAAPESAPPETHTDHAPEVALAGDAVGSLLRVERSLREAHRCSARLDERAALALLEQAETDALRALTLRSAHQWLAEVYVARGVVALQAGARELAASAFARAASLDPARKLGAAEAHPHAAALLEVAHQEQLGRAPLPFTVALQPADARAFVDGVPMQSPGPSASVRGGPHVLLVEAPGHAPYAAVIELSNGPRADTAVRLEPWTIAKQPPSPALVAEAAGAGPAHDTAPTPRKKRWAWWLAGGAVLLAGAAIAVVAHPGDGPRPTRSLVVDPGELPQ